MVNYVLRMEEAVNLNGMTGPSCHLLVENLEQLGGTQRRSVMATSCTASTKLSDSEPKYDDCQCCQHL